MEFNGQEMPMFRPDEESDAEVDATPKGIDQLRARAVKDGNHLWVVKLVYRVDDPEIAMDNMVLGMHNLIDAVTIHCHWCSIRYVNTTIPGRRCPLGQPR